MALLPNPFVGPRPLTRDNPIFGRDREIIELSQLLTAERLVLLLSPSGAGKSSLINAGLIPELNTRFDIWEPTRVNTQPPAGSTANRYVWSAINGWKLDGAEQELAPFVAARPRRHNILLIFDQFEEILRLNPADSQGRAEFFRQLAELLQNPSIWALLVIREDYLAPLLPWFTQLPTHLRARYRLSLLSRSNAASAMRGTAGNGGRVFQPAALDQFTAALADETGFIEPMHLQVVCRRLWDRMPADDLSIDPVDIDKFGDITSSLRDYYASAVADIATAHRLPERAIRDWFHKELITPAQTRGQVQQGPEHSGTLPTAVVEAFLQTHLIRIEPRRKDWWYELAHDRLLEPVLQSNTSWYLDNLNKTQQRAVLWLEQHKPDSLLLEGPELPEALTWLEAAQQPPTPAEREFIGKSQQKQQAAAREAALNLRLSSLLFRAAKKYGDMAGAAAQPAEALAHYARALRFQPESPYSRAAIARNLTSKPWPILALSVPHSGVFPDFQTLAAAPPEPNRQPITFEALFESAPPLPAPIHPTPTLAAKLAAIWNLHSPIGPYHSGCAARFPLDASTLETIDAEGGIWSWDCPGGTPCQPSTNGPIGRPLSVARNGRLCLLDYLQIWDKLAGTIGSHTFGGENDYDLLAVSPDGNVVAYCASQDGEINFEWERSIGEYRGLGWHPGRDKDVAVSIAFPIVALQFSSNSDSLLFVDSAGVPRLIDCATYKLIPPPTSLDGFPRFQIESPDGTRRLTVPLLADNQAILTDLSGTPVCETITLRGRILDVAFSHDSRFFVIVESNAPSIQLRHAANGAPAGDPFLHVNVLAISPDQNLALLQVPGRNPILHDAVTGAAIGVPLSQPDSVRFNSTGSHFVTLSNGTAQAWDTASGAAYRPSVSVSPDPEASLHLSHDGTKLLGPRGAWSLDNGAFTAISQFALQPELVVWDAAGAFALVGNSYDLSIENRGNSGFKHYVVRRDISQSGGESREILLDAEPAALALSPDSRHFVVVTEAGTARRFSSDSFAPAGPPVQAFAIPRSAALSPDGHTAVIVSPHGAVVVLNLETGQQVYRELSFTNVTSAAFDTSGDCLILSFLAAPPQLWSLTLPAQLPTQYPDPLLAIAPDTSFVRTLSPTGAWQRRDRQSGIPSGPASRCAGTILAATFSNDSRLLFTQTPNTLHTWTLEATPQLHRRVALPAPQSHCFSPDGNLLAAITKTGAWICNLHSPEPTAKPLPVAGRPIAFSPDNRWILWAPDDFATNIPPEIYDVDTLQPLKVELTHPRRDSHRYGQFVPLRHAAFDSDPRRVLTATEEEVRLWSIARDPLPQSISLTHDAPIRRHLFDPDSNLLVALTENGFLHVWDWPLLTPAAPPIRVAPDRAVMAALADKRLQLIRSTGTPATVTLTDPSGRHTLTQSEDGTHHFTFSADIPASPAPIHNSAIHPSGLYQAAGEQCGLVKIFETGSDAPRPITIQHQGPIVDLDFNPAGDCLLSASEDGTVHLTRFPDGVPYAPPIVLSSNLRIVNSPPTIERHPDAAPYAPAIRYARFAPTGRLFFIHAEDGSVGIWNAETATPLYPPLKHEQYIVRAAFSPDGKLIATVGAANAQQQPNFRLWDTASGLPLGTWQLEWTYPQQITFSPDSTGVIYHSQGNDTIYIHRIFADSGSPADTALLADLAEAIAGLAVNDDGDCEPLPDQHARLQETAARIASGDGVFAEFVRRFLPEAVWQQSAPRESAAPPHTGNPQKN